MTYLYWIHLPTHIDIMTEGYIGVSIDPKRRFQDHKSTKLNPHLSNAFMKYKDIVHTILLEGSDAYCYEMEERLRSETNIGWNINKGGTKPPNLTGRTLGSRIFRPKSATTKQKMRQAALGKTFTEETRHKLSLAKKGKPWSEKRRATFLSMYPTSSACQSLS